MFERSNQKSSLESQLEYLLRRQQLGAQPPPPVRGYQHFQKTKDAVLLLIYANLSQDVRHMSAKFRYVSQEVSNKCISILKCHSHQNL